MKVGVFLPQGWRMDLADVSDAIEKFETMSRCAVEAENAGFDGAFLYDHFHTVPAPQLESVFECWTSMAALARDTKTIRLGQMVTCNSYRPPSLLAKMASCIDVMSHGRLILGIGAGWYEHEYLAYGYDYPDTPERLRMLRESLRVVKAMWIEDEARFEGEHYRLGGAINEPKPVQKPHPPIWIGGAGEKVTLKLVAQYGDACNFNADVATVRHKLDVLRQHCATVGRDYDSVLKTLEFYTILGDKKEVDRVVADTARRTGADEGFIRRWHPLHGTAERIGELMHAYNEVGIEYFIVNLPNAAEGGVFSRFAEEVFRLSVKVERYGPGADATELDPGDFILTHRRKLIPALISWGQKRRFKGPDARFAHWSHAALVVGQDGDLVEAESMGVRRTPIHKYRDEEYHLVRLGDRLTGQGRRDAVACAEAQVGRAFGYLDLTGAALHLLFGWPLHWVRRNHELCSSLVVKALQQGGLLRDLDPALTLPADLAKAFDART